MKNHGTSPWHPNRLRELFRQIATRLSDRYRSQIDRYRSQMLTLIHRLAPVFVELELVVQRFEPSMRNAAGPELSELTL